MDPCCLGIFDVVMMTLVKDAKQPEFITLVASCVVINFCIHLLIPPLILHVF